VRAIARLHRGDVVLEEVKPHGCCFVLHIRLRHQDAGFVWSKLA
jgi:hypothetical protein